MKRLAVIGAGDLGQLIAYHAASAGYETVGFFDDLAAKGTSVSGIKILGTINDVATHYEAKAFDALMIGIGYRHMAFRKKMFEAFRENIPMATIIHPSAYVDASCTVGAGVIILPGCTLDRNVTVMDNVLMNTACSVSHDSVIGAHSFLSPRVAVAGFVNIEECCVIGINTTVIDNIRIVKETQTGGGTVVIKNIENKGLYVGNPAKFIR